MAANIKLKRSAVAGRSPQASDLDYGELALNYADGVLYYKNNSNEVANISGGGAETDSAAPTGTLRDGDLWWDAANGKLKVYYDDGLPTTSPITVSITIDAANTTNNDYSFASGWTDRTGTKTYSAGAAESLDPAIVIQQGDTITINNSSFSTHPLYFITQTGLGGSYDAAYNVELPASNYGGGTAAVSYQFNTAGTYYYICATHATMMINTITVLSTGTASKQWVDATPAGRGYTGSAGAVGYSETAPSSPSGGQIWYNSQTGKAYIYYIVSGNGQWVLFSDPTVTDGDTGYTGSVGYVGSRGTISPRSWSFLDPANLSLSEQTLFFTDTALTASDIKGVKVGGQDVTYTIRYGTNRSDTGTVVATDTATSATTGTTATISNADIPADSWLWVEIGTVNGSVAEFALNIIFSE